MNTVPSATTTPTPSVLGETGYTTSFASRLILATFLNTVSTLTVIVYQHTLHPAAMLLALTLYSLQTLLASPLVSLVAALHLAAIQHSSLNTLTAVGGDVGATIVLASTILAPMVAGTAKILVDSIRRRRDQVLEASAYVLKYICRGRVLASTGLLAASIPLPAAPYTTPVSLALTLATTILVAPLYTANTFHAAIYILNAVMTPYNATGLLVLAAAYPAAAARRVERVECTGSPDCICIGRVVYALIDNPPLLYAKTHTPLRSRWAWVPLVYHPQYCIAASKGLNAHTLIAGMSGSGKSRLAAQLIAGFSSGETAILVIDPHGEYKNLLMELRADNVYIINASTEGVNPLELGGVQPRVRAAEVANLLASILRLGPLQRKLLEEAILLSYESKGVIDENPSTWNNEPPTLEDVKRVLEALATRDQRASLLVTYLNTLSSSSFRSTSVSVAETLQPGRLTVVDLAGLYTHESKRLYVETLLRLVYGALQERGVASGTRVLIVVDEAHIFAPKTSSQPILAKMFAELRKYNTIIVAVTQQLSAIHPSIVANTEYKLISAVTEPRDLEYAARMLAGYPEPERVQTVAYMLSGLRPGAVAAKDRRVENPVIVAVNWVSSQRRL